MIDIIVPGKKDTRSERQYHRDQKRKRQKEFVGSLEIVKDAAKIKNIRRRQGVAGESNEEIKQYGKNYERIFGHSGIVKGSTGKYAMRDGKMVKVSDEIPHGKLVTL